MECLSSEYEQRNLTAAGWRYPTSLNGQRLMDLDTILSPEMQNTTILHLSDFVEEVREFLGDDFKPSNINLNLLKHRNVLCIGDDDQIIRKWSLYSCLYCELEQDGHTYLLSGGKWYRVDRDFVHEVNKYFEQLPRFERELPEYNDDAEEIYNARVCDETADFVLMDQELINYGGPRSGIESCDIYTRGKDIVHVKRYGQSKVFSHFFSQGTVSGELFHTLVQNQDGTDAMQEIMRLKQQFLVEFHNLAQRLSRRLAGEQHSFESSQETATHEGSEGIPSLPQRRDPVLAAPPGTPARRRRRNGVIATRDRETNDVRITRYIGT